MKRYIYAVFVVDMVVLGAGVYATRDWGLFEFRLHWGVIGLLVAAVGLTGLLVHEVWRAEW